MTPLTEKPSLRLPPAAPPYRILHIEDDAEVARVTCVSLELQGYICQCAADGLSSLEAMQRFQPHLILLDMMLPGMSGGEILEAIRSQSDIPVIIVSALVNDGLVLQELDRADDHLGKPFTPMELTRRVKALLTRYYETES